MQHSIPNLTMSAVWVEQSFERVRTFQRDNSKTKFINAKRMEFLALDSQLCSVVSDVGFRDWSNTCTHYHVRYLSDVALPELHSNSFTTYYGTQFGAF